MNATLLAAFWRQRSTSPLRVLLLLALLGFPLAFAGVVPQVGLAAAAEGLPLALILAAGMIGQDLSSGVLQLLFARPVRRWDYVVSRWTGVGIAGTVLMLAHMALLTAVLALRRQPPDAELIGIVAAGRVLEVWGVAAVMALLSSLVPSFGDLVLFLLVSFFANVLGIANHFKGWEALGRAGVELQRFLDPKVDVMQVFAGNVSWFEISSYLSTIALCLTLACVTVNRRELSYASASG